MATFFANLGFDYARLNINNLITRQTDFDFVDNGFYTYNGNTYEDVMFFQYYLGSYSQVYFGGFSVTMNSTQTAVTSGTMTGVIEEVWSGTNWVSYWGLENFTYSAVSVANTAFTASTLDDYQVIADIMRGADVIRLSAYADVMRGYEGNDRMTGNGGNDALYGDGGNDTLVGGAGADTLQGGNGADILTGGAGKDLLRGGAGRDVFDFNLPSESGASSLTRDVVLDFVRTTSTQLGDRIDLSGIDANVATAGVNDPFKFIGRNAFSSTDATGQLRYVVDTAAGTLTLLGSIDRDTTPEFSIQINGITGITSADIIL